MTNWYDRCALVVALSFSAAGQSVYSGAGRYSGAVFGVLSSGQTFLGYTGQDIVQWPATIPNVGGTSRLETIVYDTSYPGGTPARIARRTDRSSIPGQPNTQTLAGLGGSGVGVLFNTNDSVLHVTTGTGGDAMILFDPVNMVCAATAITRDKNQTNPGSSSSYADSDGGFFSLNDPAVWYSFGRGSADGYQTTQVVKYTFTSLTTGTYTVGPIVADFQYGFPSTVNTPAWASGRRITLAATCW